MGWFCVLHQGRNFVIIFGKYEQREAELRASKKAETNSSYGICHLVLVLIGLYIIQK